MLTETIPPPRSSLSKQTLKKRLLVVVHGHPELNKGGGEIAAYNLFKALNNRTDYESLFLARQSNQGAHHGTTPFSTRKEDELLFYSHEFDFFKFSQPNKRLLWHNFKELIENFKPTLVHFHHYLHIGLEAIRVIKNVDPNIKIVLTLHEYLAICHNSGQMVKTNKKLCYEANPADCHDCFKHITPQTFFLREKYIKSYFELVDQFIAPSNFLKDRYVNWGIKPEKIEVLENAQPLAKITSTTENKNIRLAYFGQLTQFKGLDVLLDAIDQLDKKTKKNIHLDIHGSSLDIQPPEFQEKILSHLEKQAKHVTYHGSYEPHELGTLMQEVDWVIVPSSWWENSPLVIQEAFKYRKPIICSNIGGMAEKVQHGVNGLHFRVGKASSLSQILEKVSQNPALRAQLIANITAPLIPDESAVEHNAVFEKLLLGH